MRRLLRILGKMIAAVLLLVCLAVLVLWVRSYWHRGNIEHVDTSEVGGESVRRLRWLHSERGWVWAGFEHWSWPTVQARQDELRSFANRGFPPGWSPQPLAAHANFLGASADDAGWGPLRWSAGQSRGWNYRAEYRYVRMPHGVLALLCGAWPLASLALASRRAIRRRRRALAGRCLGCGYDLRASAERCPECGRARPAR